MYDYQRLWKEQYIYIYIKDKFVTADRVNFSEHLVPFGCTNNFDKFIPC